MTVFDRPQWAALPRDLVVLLTITAGVISIAGLQAFASVLGPVVLFVLTIAVHPVITGLRRRGEPSWLATTVMLLAVFAIGARHRRVTRARHGAGRRPAAWLPAIPLTLLVKAVPVASNRTAHGSARC